MEERRTDWGHHCSVVGQRVLLCSGVHLRANRRSPARQPCRIASSDDAVGDMARPRQGTSQTAGGPWHTVCCSGRCDASQSWHQKDRIACGPDLLKTVLGVKWKRKGRKTRRFPALRSAGRPITHISMDLSLFSVSCSFISEECFTVSRFMDRGPSPCPSRKHAQPRVGWGRGARRGWWGCQEPAVRKEAGKEARSMATTHQQQSKPVRDLYRHQAPSS